MRSLALLFTFAFGSAALAEPVLPAIAAKKILRVGMSPGLTPFVAVGADATQLRTLLGEHAPPEVKTADGRGVCGFDVELAGEAAQALGARLEVVLVDKFEELLPGLRAGRYDLVASGLTTTLERATTVAFSEPYFASGLVVLVRDPKRFVLLDSLRAPGVKVAFQRGTTAAAFVARELARATAVPLDGDAALYRAMDDPALADAVVIDYVAARDAAVRGRVKAALVPVEERRFTTESFAFAARQGDPDFIAWLNLFVRQEKGSGAFHRLAARYNAWFKTER